MNLGSIYIRFYLYQIQIFMFIFTFIGQLLGQNQGQTKNERFFNLFNNKMITYRILHLTK